jgi:hypothetical protein
VVGVPADREAEVYEKFEFLEGIFVSEAVATAGLKNKPRC